MPEQPPPKYKPTIARPTPATPAATYVPLQVASNFSFLAGASHPEELVAHAAAIGCPAVALTDNHSLAGIVRAHVAAKEAGIQLVVGASLSLISTEEVAGTAEAAVAEAATLLAYPLSRAGYAGLCRLLTLGKSRAGKGACRLFLHDLHHCVDLLGIYVPQRPLGEEAAATLRQLKGLLGPGRIFLGATHQYAQNDAAHLRGLAALGRDLRVPIAAAGEVLYHAPMRQRLQDVLCCIRHGCSVQQAGFLLHANAERHMKTPEEMVRLFAHYPEAIANTLEIARQAGGFSLDQLRYQYPAEICPAGTTPMEHLRQLTWQGARGRYPGGIPGEVERRLLHEFQLIDELAYPAYFLTVHDIVQFAVGRGILCQGRGAAANSAVCYCLGITAVDPSRIDLLMERFISKERNEPPDIDIDFEHERREEVIQYIYNRFGRHRAALTAEVITYRRRSALRDVGKALGLSLDCVDMLAKAADWWEPQIMPEALLRRLGLDPRQPAVRLTVQLAAEILGFPRHLSQHVGGFVITEDPLCELVPIEPAAMEDRSVIEWDKDDIDAMGMLKIDILALGMLTCIRKGLDLLNANNRVAFEAASGPESACGPGAATAAPLALHTVPPDSPAVYDMLCNADSLGVFQVESRAQMAMLPRMKPRCYYDLVIEVAIVRPGPIQGKMVHPYLRRRNGEEPAYYPDEAIRTILGRTLGVPLFQEQVMRLAMVAAGFSGGEADALRRSMAAWKRKENLLYLFGQRLFDGMVSRGYSPVFAHRCFEQIKGFGEYGFPESHAASFALLVYVSAWLKCFHPAAFAAALINSQPMGFYQPAQIVRDAQAHGVTVRPVDVHASQWNCTLESRGGGATPALRLGMRLVRSLPEREACLVSDAVRREGPFASVAALWRASKARVATLRALASADAFGSMGLSRQQALWAVRALRDVPLPLFDGLQESDAPAALPPISASRNVTHDYMATGLSLKAHPISFVRQQLRQRRVTPAAALLSEELLPHATPVAIAGLVLVRQRPATAKGILFMTIEDETGTANLIVRPAVYQRHRPALHGSGAIIAHGVVQRQGKVVHLLVRHAEDLYATLHSPGPPAMSRDFH